MTQQNITKINNLLQQYDITMPTDKIKEFDADDYNYTLVLLINNLRSNNKYFMNNLMQLEILANNIHAILDNSKSYNDTQIVPNDDIINYDKKLFMQVIKKFVFIDEDFKDSFLIPDIVNHITMARAINNFADLEAYELIIKITYLFQDYNKLRH